MQKPGTDQKKNQKAHRNWILLAIPYFALLFYIFFLARRRAAIFNSGIRSLNLTPLKNKIDFYRATYFITPELRWSFYTDLLGNILLFVPFTILLVFAFGIKSLKKVFLISLFTSVSIESIQYAFRIGVADIDDVILNVTGALIGITFIKLIQKIKLPLLIKAFIR